MKSDFFTTLVQPSRLTTAGQLAVRWISAISSCLTSRYVAGDDITRDRLGAKYLWLIFVRQRTKCTSSKIREVDGSIAPFVITLKNSITHRMHSNFSLCKDTNLSHLLSTDHSSVNRINQFPFPENVNITVGFRL